ncbi:MAG: hypothetical protein JNN12_03680 [Bacteroidetes Order II. Incertae sedis bacterium]|nr:hypothetical protein [Bacteroidetes Order II. bacterium]
MKIGLNAIPIWVKSLLTGLLMVVVTSLVMVTNLQKTRHTNSEVWKLLLKTQYDRETYRPTFSAEHQKLENKTITLQGYLVPIELAFSTDHFGLTPDPSDCQFCVGVGPEKIVELNLDRKIRYTDQPVEVQGTFSLLPNSDLLLFYRLDRASVRTVGQ